ncbi:M23 family metallopeptidase [Streptomyces boninensis]|uniref:M23 family metallopeptidase n=1 Tax=Streptomyces boninensis TaxID=2039455 RepID=UPI003B2181E2
MAFRSLSSVSSVKESIACRGAAALIAALAVSSAALAVLPAAQAAHAVPAPPVGVAGQDVPGDDRAYDPRPKSPWAKPVLRGEISARYGQPGNLWIAGHHTGVDLAVPTGTPVQSVGPGRVSEVSTWGSYGHHIKVLMDDGKYVLYAHLSRIDVSTGDRVGPGTSLGLSGATGNATGPHLHFEVRDAPGYGTDIDPVAYLVGHGVFLGTNTRAPGVPMHWL